MKFISALMLCCSLALLVGQAQAVTKLALGDSLAVGFGGASHASIVGAIGISSCAIAKMVPHKHFDAVLISAGTNDPPGPCIEQIRQLVEEQVCPSKVTWIVPVINDAAINTQRVANAWNDQYVTYTPSRKRKVWPHPNSYYNVF